MVALKGKLRAASLAIWRHIDTHILIPLERVIAFSPQLARVLGGIEAAIYLQQLYFWSDKGSRSDGFIYKTKDDIEAETTLTRRQQDPIRKRLEALGLLETKLVKANGSPTLHYRLNVGAINALVNSTKGTNGNVQDALNQETYKRDDSKRPQCDIPITEKTTESTQEMNPSEASTEEPLGVTPLKNRKKAPEDITVTHAFQATAKRVIDKLGSKPGQQTSVLKVCRDAPPAVIDVALANAIDYPNPRDRTQVFLAKVARLRVVASVGG